MSKPESKDVPASLHGIVGVTVCVLYAVHFFVGGPLLRAWRYKLQVCVQFGNLTAYMTVALTVLLGIQEQETMAGCSGTVHGTHDTDIRHVSCLQSHVLGILVFFMTVSTCWALYEHDIVGGGSGRRAGLSLIHI